MGRPLGLERSTGFRTAKISFDTCLRAAGRMFIEVTVTTISSLRAERKYKDSPWRPFGALKSKGGLEAMNISTRRGASL